MRLEEKCPCGGSLVMDYKGDNRSYSSGSEHAEARDQIEKFRRAHKACLKQRQEKAA